MSRAELINYLKELIETWNMNRPSLKELHTTFEISKWPLFQNGHRFKMAGISCLSYSWGDFDQTSHKDRSSSKAVHLSFKKFKMATVSLDYYLTWIIGDGSFKFRESWNKNRVQGSSNNCFYISKRKPFQNGHCLLRCFFYWISWRWMESPSKFCPQQNSETTWRNWLKLET